MKTLNLKVLADHLSDVNKKIKATSCNDHDLYLLVTENTESKIISYHYTDSLFLILEGEMEFESSEGKKVLRPYDFVSVRHQSNFKISFSKRTVYLKFQMTDQLPEEHQSFKENPTIQFGNVEEQYNHYHGQHHNIELARVNDHQFRMGIHTGEYPEHHHPNSDEIFLFLKGEYHVAHILGEENFEHLDVMQMKKYEFHKPYAPKRSLMLYFERKDIRTITYEGADYMYSTD